MNTVERYLGRTVLLAIALSLTALLALMVFAEFVDNTDQIPSGCNRAMRCFRMNTLTHEQIRVRHTGGLYLDSRLSACRFWKGSCNDVEYFRSSSVAGNYAPVDGARRDIWTHYLSARLRVDSSRGRRHFCA